VLNRTIGIRGIVTLALLGVLAGALVVSPVGAAPPLTKAKVKKIAKKEATEVFEDKVAKTFTVESQKDSTGASTSRDQQINAVSINVPEAGLLVISGHAQIDDDSTGTSEIMCLRPRVDGANVVTGTGTGQVGGPLGAGEAACYEFNSGGAEQSDEATIAYTVTAPVASGTHTVTQAILNLTAGAVAYEWFNSALTALFVPDGEVTTARVVGTPAHTN
jgi:phage baseplate assembly protein gpV